MAEALITIALILFFIIIVITLFISLFIFWILMIIDCVKRKFKNPNEQIVWILLLIFLGFIAAIIYYFVVKRK